MHIASSFFGYFPAAANVTWGLVRPLALSRPVHRACGKRQNNSARFPSTSLPSPCVTGPVSLSLSLVRFPYSITTSIAHTHTAHNVRITLFMPRVC